jgi:hypothetical protein
MTTENATLSIIDTLYGDTEQKNKTCNNLYKRQLEQ